MGSLWQRSFMVFRLFFLVVASSKVLAFSNHRPLKSADSSSRHDADDSPYKSIDLFKSPRGKTWLCSGFFADLQSDSKYGRGEFHLSADLNEGDVVAYQSGSWLVDGVLVGEGKAPKIEYCQIETIQVVWTHNCEHGVLRGMELRKSGDGKSPLTLEVTGEAVEFGPEQLLARIPVEWDGESSLEACTPLVSLDESNWMLEVD